MMLGTNVPSMSGFSPMGLWIQMAAISQNVDLDPALAVCMASGNVAVATAWITALSPRA